jgi:UDP:flavonoid glycosyltransferase YjiC (YdhE family)
VPDTVTVLPWVPQADLLPHTDLVAHHGGSGTTLGAVAAGVPQLLLPQGADQFLNAGAVADSGAGKQLIDADADAITETARILLSDGTIAAAARALAQEIAAMPSPQELAVRLPEWATR